MSPTSYQTAPPRDKAGAEVYDRSKFGSIRHIHLQESPLLRAFLLIGTEKGTRTPTPYGHNHLKVACLPIPPPRHYNSFAAPKTAANPVLLLFWSSRNISRYCSWFLLPFQNRNIICCRLLLHFQYRWIWQTYLSQLVSFLFSKVT